MTDRKDIIYALDMLLKKGADKAHVVLSETTKHELNAESGKISLMRTTCNKALFMRAIRGNRKGDFSANKTDYSSIDDAAEKAVGLSDASAPDPAYDISEKQTPEEFRTGDLEPDRDLVYDRLSDFIRLLEKEYPKTILERAIVDFTSFQSRMMNSNGVDFSTTLGLYGVSVMFTSKEGKKTSSFNHSGVLTRKLDSPLIDCGTIRTLIGQSCEQIETKSIKDKFIGDIIITPDCLEDFIRFFTNSFLSDYGLISGSSILKDSLDCPVAHPGFTLSSGPTSPDLAWNYFITPDGYKASDCAIIGKGILKTFLLSLYGSNKTGKPRAVNSGGCYIIEPGNVSYDEMIRSVKKGILLCRVSGGSPNDKGDFSVVAKNSYYIEDGKIMYPVNETMIFGNLLGIFKNMKMISKERINFGSGIFPWALAEGVTVSGK